MVGAKHSRRVAAAPVQCGPECAGGALVPRRGTGSTQQRPLGFLCSPSARAIGGPRLRQHWTRGGICPLFGIRCWASCSFL